MLLTFSLDPYRNISYTISTTINNILIDSAQVRNGVDAGKDMSAFRKYTKGTGGGPPANIPECKLPAQVPTLLGTVRTKRYNDWQVMQIRVTENGFVTFYNKI